VTTDASTVAFGGCKPSSGVVLGRLRTLQVRGARCVLAVLDFRSPIRDGTRDGEH